MTTIVAIQGDGFAVVGVDSRLSTIDESGFASQRSTMREGSSKVAEVGRYLLAAAGDVRAINLLHHAFSPPKPLADLHGTGLDRFITVKFVPALRACFEDNGYSRPDSAKGSHVAEHDSTVVVVVNAVVYIVDGDYSWASDDDGIYAVGSGAQYALGAMQATRPRKFTVDSAKKCLLKGLASASTFDAYTGSPYVLFVQTKNLTERL